MWQREVTPMRSSEDEEKALDCFAHGLAHLAGAHGCERAAQIAAQAVLYLHDHPEPLNGSAVAPPSEHRAHRSPRTDPVGSGPRRRTTATTTRRSNERSTHGSHL